MIHSFHDPRKLDGSIIKRAIRDFGSTALTTIGAFRTMSFVFGDLFPTAIVVPSAIGVGLWRSRYRNSVTIDIPATDSSVELSFGDVFEDGSVIIIPVNEFFDGELGDHVSELSIHGQFIKKILLGDSERFYHLTEAALTDVDATTLHRNSRRCKQYPIGTVARVIVHERTYLLVALSRTDLTSLKASATIDELWSCLAGIWKAIRIYSGGTVSQLPLIGSGLSGVGLPPKNLIEVILTSFLFYSKKQKIADRVTLVLPRNLWGKIDLLSIKRNWS